MQKLIINRDIWLRREGWSNSRLFRPKDGKMCCLGIYLENCGISREILADIATPAILARNFAQILHLIPETLVSPTNNDYYDGFSTTEICLKLMGENDGFADEITLRNLFSQIGVEVEFTGGE